MINFSNPEYLYILIAIPVIAIIYLLVRHSRQKRLKRFGQHYNAEQLMPDASKYLPNLKVILQLAALAFIVIAFARPYAHKEEDVNRSAAEEAVKGIEVMICCDISNSMLASANDDINGTSRLRSAKFILDKAVTNMIDDRVGLVIFAGNAELLLPLTPDVNSAKRYINSLNTNMITLQGTAIGSAINLAVASFDPNSDMNKTILIVTDGENFDDDAIAAAQHAAEAGIQVNVIGMGSTANGMPIPVAEIDNKYNDSRIGASGDGFMTFDGEAVMTRLDAEGAAEIAKAGGGIYISGANSKTAVDELNVQLNKIGKTEYSRTVSKNTGIPANSIDLFPIFVIVALILLIIDGLLPYRKLEWLRGVKFFSKK